MEDNRSSLKASEQNIIRGISLFYAAIFIYTIITEWDLIQIAVIEFSDDVMLSISYLAPYILLPIGIIGFWQRKNWGWILLTIFVAFSATVMLIELGRLVSLSSGNEEEYLDLSDSMPVINVIRVLVYIITMILLCRNSLRYTYRITSTVMSVVIVLSVLLAAALAW